MTETGKISDLIVYFVLMLGKCVREKKNAPNFVLFEKGKELRAHANKKAKAKHWRFEIFHFYTIFFKFLAGKLVKILGLRYDTMKMTVFRDRKGRKRKQQKKHKNGIFSVVLCVTFGVKKKRSFENSEVIFCGLYTILVNASARSETVFTTFLVRLNLNFSLIYFFFFFVQLFLIDFNFLYGNFPVLFYLVSFWLSFRNG